MRLNVQKPYFLTLLFLPIAVQSADRVYKWVDAQGQTHYGNHAATLGNEAGVGLVKIKPNIIKSIPIPHQQAKPTKPQSRDKQTIPVRDQIDKAYLRCERARNNLKKIRARLRAGYKYDQYSKLHAREAEYRAQRAAYCR